MFPTPVNEEERFQEEKNENKCDKLGHKLKSTCTIRNWNKQVTVFSEKYYRALQRNITESYSYP